MISAEFGDTSFLRGELQIDAKNSNFEKFESTLYMKPLSVKVQPQNIILRKKNPR